MVQTLDVYLWDKKLGTLVAYKDKYALRTALYYDKDFIDSGVDPSPIYGSIESTAVKNGMPVFSDNDRIYEGLPPFIAHSLPDHWGNKILSEWAKTHSIKTKNLTPLDKLAFIGKRAMGALEFMPPSFPQLEMSVEVAIDDLFRQANIALKEARGVKTNDISDMITDSLFRVGTSAGGRHPKAVVNYNERTNTFYSGQVPDPDPNVKPLIVKFDEKTHIPYTRIEYSYFLLAQQAGLKMSASKIFEENDSFHFLTERFDRKGAEKLHVLSLAGLSPHADSYEDLFSVAQKLDVSEEDIINIFKNMTLNVLGGNVDDHNKNFSFILPRNGRWEAAPAYDFTFTVQLSAPTYTNRHSMSINGKTYDILRSDLLAIAAEFNIRNANQIIDDCIEAISHYPDHAINAGLEYKWLTEIGREISDRITILDSQSQSAKYRL